ncbi:MAG: hypothetical protein ACM3Y9_04860 [Ignavibacteria bacterium]
MRPSPLTDMRCAAALLAALSALPCAAAEPAKAASDAKRAVAAPAKAVPESKPAAPPPAKAPAKPKPVAAKPAGPDDLTVPGMRHLVVCPPPRISACVMKKPVPGGYRVMTNGVDVADNGATWVVDFGKGPKGSMFLLQVLDAGGGLHDIEVSFRAKPGMQKTPALPEE